ncbi:MAG: BrnT family toxin [Actinomycetes bacterium]
MSYVIYDDIEWDDANIEHLARHGITPDEVEDLLEGRTVRLRMATDAPDRFPVLGRTSSGRYLLIIYQEKPYGVIRPFTGRDMRPHERRLYERQTGS